MKKILTQAIFFISIFGIILVVLNVSVRKKKDYVLRFKPAQVESVAIQNKGQTLQLAQSQSPEGPVWVVKDGGQTAAADDRAAQTYLAFLARITVVERFAAADFADAVSREWLGLGTLGEISLHLKSGKQMDLLLGRQTPSGTEIYAATPSQPDTIFTISNGFEKKLIPDFMGLRSRQIFPMTDAPAMAVTYTDIPVTMTLPLMKALRALVYSNYFPAVAEGDLAQYGLSLPDVTIGDYDLSRYSGRYFMRRNAPGGQDVLILTGQSGDDLFKVLKELVIHRGTGGL